MKNENRCYVEGCDRKKFILKHGLCRAHYDRLRVHNDVGSPAIRFYRDLMPYPLMLAQQQQQIELRQQQQLQQHQY